MVAEARAVRERMLGDLARRRRAAQLQLEQLRVARERLVSAYEVVRRTLDEVTAELAAAEPEARLAAEAVARRMSSEPDYTPPEGVHLGTGPVPVVDPETPPGKEFDWSRPSPFPVELPRRPNRPTSTQPPLRPRHRHLCRRPRRRRSRSLPT